MIDIEAERVRPSTNRWLRITVWLGRVWRTLMSMLIPPKPVPMIPMSPAPPPPPSPPPAQVRARRTLQTPLVVPANGYVFYFRVHASFHWAAQGMYQDQLTTGVDSVMPYPVRRLKAIAAEHARRHAPHRARELEQDLQQVLADAKPWIYTWRGLKLSCEPHVWVELDEPVKEAVRPYWEQLIRLECEHDVQVRRAEYTETLSKRWTEILTGLMGSPAATGAAEMTEKDLAKKDLAEVVGRIVAEQRAAAETLERLMEEKTKSPDMQVSAEHFEQLRERLEQRADKLFRPAADHGEK